MQDRIFAFRYSTHLIQFLFNVKMTGRSRTHRLEKKTPELSTTSQNKDMKEV